MQSANLALTYGSEQTILQISFASLILLGILPKLGRHSAEVQARAEVAQQAYFCFGCVLFLAEILPGDLPELGFHSAAVYAQALL